MSLKCVSLSVKGGYAACPTGMQRCQLPAWHRPLCAAENLVGLNACDAFDTLAMSHKLAKINCP